MNTNRSAIDPMPEYFDRYINLVDDISLRDAFDRSIEQIDAFDTAALDRIGAAVYEPGKWTVPGILQHITDFERIFGYRSMVYARSAGISPQGIDQDVIAANSRAEHRTARQILADLRAARLANKALFESFDDEMLSARGLCWKYEMPVLAIGFTTIGHQIHHFRIIEERYYSLAGETAKGVGND